MKQRTALIERYHVWGTHRHMLRVTYMGCTLSWWKDGHKTVAEAYDDSSAEVIEAMKGHARKQGFTHCRIVGDWERRAKPQGGKL